MCCGDCERAAARLDELRARFAKYMFSIHRRSARAQMRTSIKEMQRDARCIFF
jgi:hypothetical protein